MENRYEKYKDSGIAWIGEIPEHWEVVKIKYLAKIKSGDSISSNEIIQEGIYEVYGGNGLMGITYSTSLRATIHSRLPRPEMQRDRRTNLHQATEN